MYFLFWCSLLFVFKNFLVWGGICRSGWSCWRSIFWSCFGRRFLRRIFNWSRGRCYLHFLLLIDFSCRGLSLCGCFHLVCCKISQCSCCLCSSDGIKWYSYLINIAFPVARLQLNYFLNNYYIMLRWTACGLRSYYHFPRFIIRVVILMSNSQYFPF